MNLPVDFTIDLSLAGLERIFPSPFFIFLEGADFRDWNSLIFQDNFQVKEHSLGKRCIRNARVVGSIPTTGLPNSP